MPPFPKGQSGNPGGRPKGQATLRRYVEARTKSGRDLVDQAIDVLSGKEQDVAFCDGALVTMPPSLKAKAEARMYLTKVGRFPLEPDASEPKDQSKDDAPMTDRELELLRAPGTVHPIKPEEK